MPGGLTTRGETAGDHLLREYRPHPGVPDELMEPGGRVRPLWERLVAGLAARDPADLPRSFARGDQYLRDAGVFLRQFGASQASERAWPFSHVPILIGEAEWRELAAALAERADLLEAVAADLYGDGRLVSEGHLPASIVAASPEWARPLVGVRPASGHFLHFVAFDLGRGPDGRWWVLGDRTQAPSGAGFALENRVAAARTFPDLFADSNVHRLAGFFRRFQARLNALGGPEAWVAVLTPGLLSDTHSEHAFIARYLGLPLVEGEDLTVASDRVLLRTVGGLLPIGVLWRRIDAHSVDPNELDEGSLLGTPGLVGAVRAGTVTMVNALGAGLLETRAFFAFLPSIAERLTGRPLSIPNVATWWCGDDDAREYVRANLARLAIGPAHSTVSTGSGDLVAGARFAANFANLSDAWLHEDAPRLVGQEAVTLSTTPAWEGGRLVPRPMSLRVFLARTADGWEAMPGGFGRIGRSDDPTALALQAGGGVADVWIVSDRPVSPDTLLPQGADRFRRADPGVLPSRAADNLFWLGRYVERAESIMRLLRAHQVRLTDMGDAGGPLLSHLASVLDGFGVEIAANGGAPEVERILANAVLSAGRIRDRFSVDGWLALNDLAKSARRLNATMAAGDDAARAYGVLLRKVTGFSGLVHENMYRSEGWRFLGLGRSLERAMDMAALLAALVDQGSPDGSLDAAVEIGDSVMTHRRRFSLATSRETVVDLLALDAENPRSVAYEVREIHDHVLALPGAGPQDPRSPVLRAVVRLHADFRAEVPEAVDAAWLKARQAALAELSELIAAAWLH